MQLINVLECCALLILFAEMENASQKKLMEAMLHVLLFHVLLEPTVLMGNVSLTISVTVLLFCVLLAQPVLMASAFLTLQLIHHVLLSTVLLELIAKMVSAFPTRKIFAT